MKFNSIILTGILCSCLAVGTVDGQSLETVIITKNDGDTISFTTTLRSYKGKKVFPDDTKEYIKGKIEDKKVKLQKSEINSIRLLDGSEYILEKVGWKFYIGSYITKGEINIFKCYTYENMANFSSSAPFLPREGVTDISKGKDNQSSRAYNSINKTATANYYNVRRGSFYIIIGNRDFKQLATNSGTFEEYIEENGIPNGDLEYENAFIFYNEECKI